jgi:hypothetical protein
MKQTHSAKARTGCDGLAGTCCRAGQGVPAPPGHLEHGPRPAQPGPSAEHDGRTPLARWGCSQSSDRFHTRGWNHGSFGRCCHSAAELAGERRTAGRASQPLLEMISTPRWWTPRRGHASIAVTSGRSLTCVAEIRPATQDDFLARDHQSATSTSRNRSAITKVSSFTVKLGSPISARTSALCQNLSCPDRHCPTDS